MLLREAEGAQAKWMHRRSCPPCPCIIHPHNPLLKASRQQVTFSFSPLSPSPRHSRVTKPGSGELRHGTEGWACLETSCRAMGQMLEGCDAEGCRPFLTRDFRALVAR